MSTFLVVAVLAGLALRRLLGRSVRDLAGVRLHGEVMLLILFVVQLLLPGLRLTGVMARVAYWVWVLTFPALVGVCWFNRRLPGMLLLGAGLMLNGLVIVLNGGMPVSQAALEVVRHARVLSIPTTDFVHVVLGLSTKLAWLADILPVPGPTGIASVASAGDCLLLVGVCDFLARVNLPIQLGQSE